jgi:RNA polymerase primary sigma factor
LLFQFQSFAVVIDGLPIVVHLGIDCAQISQSRAHASGEDEGSKLIDYIQDTTGVSPTEAMIKVNLKEKTAEVLRTLNPREEKIIRMRFGLEDGSQHTLEEVGLTFQVTRERIRQIEAKALRKLRHPSRARHLSAFVDRENH